MGELPESPEGTLLGILNRGGSVLQVSTGDREELFVDQPAGVGRFVDQRRPHSLHLRLHCLRNVRGHVLGQPQLLVQFVEPSPCCFDRLSRLLSLDHLPGLGTGLLSYLHNVGEFVG